MKNMRIQNFLLDYKNLIPCNMDEINVEQISIPVVWKEHTLENVAQTFTTEIYQEIIGIHILLVLTTLLFITTAPTQTAELQMITSLGNNVIS
jgi:hypothetical protein